MELAFRSDPQAGKPPDLAPLQSLTSMRRTHPNLSRIEERSGVSLHDLGLGDIAFLTDADKFMQLVSALMAVRADARLTVFGLWLLCHMIYVLYLIYAHVFK